MSGLQDRAGLRSPNAPRPTRSLVLQHPQLEYFEESPASLCGAEEQNARAIGTYAQCDCSNYLEIDSVS